MKVITTRYVGPGNVRGSAIIAKTEGNKTIRVNYDCALSSEQNHAAAVKALCDKMGKDSGCEGEYQGGTLPDSKTLVWVQLSQWCPRVTVKKYGVSITSR